MAERAYKLLLFLKRRPGMSLEEFRDYYERVHSKLGEKHMSGACRYIRRYLEPLRDPVTGNADSPEYDVLTEVWFDDRAIFENVRDFVARGEIAADILADEERLFDRSKSRYATVVEMESDLPPAAG